MARIAIATASDGRDFVHEEVGPFGLEVQDRLVAACARRATRSSPATATSARTPTRVRLGRELAAPGPT